jgi:hypothetical protein
VTAASCVTQYDFYFKFILNFVWTNWELSQCIKAEAMKISRKTYLKSCFTVYVSGWGFTSSSGDFFEYLATKDLQVLHQIFVLTFLVILQ